MATPYDVGTDERGLCRIPVFGVPTDLVGLSITKVQNPADPDGAPLMHIEGWVDNKPDKDDPEAVNGLVPQKLHSVILLDLRTAMGVYNYIAGILRPG